VPSLPWLKTRGQYIEVEAVKDKQHRLEAAQLEAVVHTQVSISLRRHLCFSLDFTFVEVVQSFLLPSEDD